MCFDESPVQLTSETRHPLPARPGQPARYDSEYKREGTANLFLFVQPLHGWRQVNVTHQRTKRDFAEQMRLLVDEYFPTAERIPAGCGQPQHPYPRGLVRRSSSDEARRMIRKLEFSYTPKHGSWLAYGGVEFAVLAGQCLDRRIPNIETLQEEIAAWQSQRNQRLAKIHWQFDTDVARVKLKRPIPPWNPPKTRSDQRRSLNLSKLLRQPTRFSVPLRPKPLIPTNGGWKCISTSTCRRMRWCSISSASRTRPATWSCGTSRRSCTPSWSIHSGAGSQSYTFIWGMVGENQTFDDMDPVAMADLY